MSNHNSLIPYLERLYLSAVYAKQSNTTASESSISSGDKASLEEALSAFNRHPQFSRYSLEEDDMRVICGIFNLIQTDFELEVTARELIQMTQNLGKNLCQRVEFIVRLLDREIISFARSHFEDYHYDIPVVLESRYILNCYFLNLLMGKKPIPEARRLLAMHLPTDTHPIDLICMYLHMLFTYYPELGSDLTENVGYRYGKTVHEFLNPLLKEIEKLDPEHSLKVLIAKHHLSAFDLKSLLLIYYFDEGLTRKVELASIANLLSKTQQQYEFNKRYLSYNSILKLDGLIKSGWRGPFKDTSIELTEKGLREIRGY